MAMLVHSAQVYMFARMWVAWVAARGGAATIDKSRYLDVAEEFAATFLAAGGQLPTGAGDGGRLEDAFQAGLKQDIRQSP